MKSYLVEFDCLVVPEPVIEIIVAESEEATWSIAYEKSKRTGLSQGNFSMYCLLRNPGGYLYLADQEFNEIRSGYTGSYLV